MERKRKLQVALLLSAVLALVVTVVVVFAWGPTWFDTNYWYIDGPNGDDDVVRIRQGSWWNVSGGSAMVNDADVFVDSLKQGWYLSTGTGPYVDCPPSSCDFWDWYTGDLEVRTVKALKYSFQPAENFGTVKCEQIGDANNNFLSFSSVRCWHVMPPGGWPEGTVMPTPAPTMDPNPTPTITPAPTMDPDPDCWWESVGDESGDYLDEYVCPDDPVGIFTIDFGGVTQTVPAPIPGYAKCMTSSGWDYEGYEFTYNSSIPRITAYWKPSCIFQPLGAAAMVPH